MSSTPPLPTIAIVAGVCVLAPLVVTGKEAIVVLHSFAGVYSGGALKGLSKTEYAQQGKPGGVVAVVSVDPVSLLFHKLPDEARSWANKIRRQAVKPLPEAVSYAPFEDHFHKGHLAFLKCAEDECVHPPGQAKFIATAGIREIDKLPTSHMRWLEMADATAGKILDLVERVRR